MSAAIAIRLARPPRAAARRAPADPVVLLIREHYRCAESLGREARRHDAACATCPATKPCDLGQALWRLITNTREMARALEWLALDKVPDTYSYSGWSAGWMDEAGLPGPWRQGK